SFRSCRPHGGVVAVGQAVPRAAADRRTLADGGFAARSRHLVRSRRVRRATLCSVIHWVYAHPKRRRSRRDASEAINRALSSMWGGRSGAIPRVDGSAPASKSNSRSLDRIISIAVPRRNRGGCPTRGLAVPRL